MEFKTRIPFAEMLGMELQRFDPDEAEIHLQLRDGLTNSWGVAHGGVTMSLLDVVMAHAARSPSVAGGDAQPGVVTIEMKTSFMRPGEGRLIATGRRLHRTASMAFCEGFVHSTAGLLVGHASATFKYLRGLPVAGRRVEKPDASD